MPSDQSNMETKWLKSSRSSFNGNCVEVAQLPDGQWAIRDSKNRAGAVLIFTACEWASFVGAVKNREFEE